MSETSTNSSAKTDSSIEGVANESVASEETAVYPTTPSKVTVIANTDLQKDKDDIEPRLKYTKITQLPPAVFAKDPVSAFLAGDTFFAFATHSGAIHLTKPDLSLIRSYRAHRASVLGLSTDGTYLASSSMDGTVVIMNINDEKDITGNDFKRPVHSVALDPNYKATKAFISGGMAGDVILSERGWLGQRSDTVLQTSEDPVIAVYWLEGVIIWMNDSGINIYSQFTKNLLLNIPRPEDSPRADLYKPRICTPESNRIYIAWADWVWNLKITVTKTKDTRSLLSSGASMVFSSSSSVRSMAIEQTISVESTLHTPCLVAGIAAFKEDSIMLLSYTPPPENERLAGVPKLCLIDLETSLETYRDDLDLKGYERLGLNDYHLCQYADNTTTKFLIISARDGIVAKERDLGDRVEWLLEHKKFKEAWEFSANFKLPLERYDIGLNWVEEEVEEERWEAAVSTLEMIQRSFLETDVKSESLSLDPEDVELSHIETLVRDNWNVWGWRISKAGHTDELASILPTDPKLKLEGKLYEYVLTRFIDEGKLDQLLAYLSTWSVELYEFGVIKQYIEGLLQDSPPQEENLRNTLADLYISSGDPLAAVPHLLILHDQRVLELVSQHHLLSSLLPQIPDLLTIAFKTREDLELAPLPIIREMLAPALTIVVRARHEVSPNDVVREILGRNMDVVVFLYLEKLTNIDPYSAQQFSDLQARLYAEFDRPKLMAFLKKSTYNYEAIAEVCESRGYIPELVYILGRIGQNKRALKLIIEELKDCEQAIDFAKQQNDKELWDDLLDYCMERPEFIKIVLEKAHGAIPPAKIIERIPLHLHIPGLKPAIEKIFSEHELVMSINRDILEVVKKEARASANALRALRREGTALNFVEYAEKLNEPKFKRQKLGKDDEKEEDLDFTQTIVVLPNGTLKTESALLGDTAGWGQTYAVGTSTFSSPSVSQKVKHLAYIKRQLQLLIH